MGLWPFGGRMTTDDSEEHIHRYNEQKSVQESVDLQVRLRQSHNVALEGDMQRQQRTIRDQVEEIHVLKRYIDAVEGVALSHYLSDVAVRNVLERDGRARNPGNTDQSIEEELEEKMSQEFKRLAENKTYVEECKAHLRTSIHQRLPQLNDWQKRLLENHRL